MMGGKSIIWNGSRAAMKLRISSGICASGVLLVLAQARVRAPVALLVLAMRALTAVHRARRRGVPSRSLGFSLTKMHVRLLLRWHLSLIIGYCVLCRVRVAARHPILRAASGSRRIR